MIKFKLKRKLRTTTNNKFIGELQKVFKKYGAEMVEVNLEYSHAVVNDLGDAYIYPALTTLKFYGTATVKG